MATYNNSARMPSPKKSPKSDSSIGKVSKHKSAKLKSESDPPIDKCTQTERTAVCFTCMRQFTNSINLQAHLLVMDHSHPQGADRQICRVCKLVVNTFDVERHRCSVYKSLFLNFVSSGITLRSGPPYRCLYCRALPLASRIDLVVHLLCQHRPKSQPNRCGMCEFTFQQPPPLKETKLPQLPANASAEQKKAHERKAQEVKEAAICEQPVILEDGLLALKDHTETEHVPGYTLLYKNALIKESHKRCPYACPLCCCQLKSNHDFHAHILCCHGNATPVEEEIHICAMCGFAGDNLPGLNYHVLSTHSASFKRLADMWMKNQLLMNATDLGNVCAYCWQVFEHEFCLQAHLIVSHTGGHPLQCGWCKTDFRSCSDPILAMLLMQNHERNHGLELHQVALDTGYTILPKGEVFLEVPDKKLLIDERLSRMHHRPKSPEKRKVSPKKSKSPVSSGSKKSKKR